MRKLNCPPSPSLASLARRDDLAVHNTDVSKPDEPGSDNPGIDNPYFHQSSSPAAIPSSLTRRFSLLSWSTFSSTTAFSVSTPPMATATPRQNALSAQLNKLDRDLVAVDANDPIGLNGRVAKDNLLTSAPPRPLIVLAVAFVAYKAVLLTVAFGAAAFGDYDTSTDLFFAVAESQCSFLPPLSSSAALTCTPTRLPNTPLSLPRQLLGRLIHWDAVHFTNVARRGYVYEHEWAFGPGFPAIVRALARGSRLLGLSPADLALAEPLAGVLAAHSAHWCAVLALHAFTLILSHNPALALVSALLHILSPAGVFLSAPYAESSFACLSFLGFFAFARALGLHHRSSPAASGMPSSKSYLSTSHSLSPFSPTSQSSAPISSSLFSLLSPSCRAAWFIASGSLLGLATLFRSNGVLNGILFAAEALRGLNDFFQDPCLASVIALLPVLAGGSLIGLGFAAPQAAAYFRYCSTTEPRLWCSRLPPSIYAYVQNVYWNVGFLRYWTLPKLPLFAIAAPVLTVLAWSAYDTLRSPLAALRPCAQSRINDGTELSPATRSIAHQSYARQLASRPSDENADSGAGIRLMLRSLALTQAVLASLAVTTYHVQIINRISSGYPVWYWWAASHMAEGGGHSWRAKASRALCVFMVTYGVIQCALFAAFLPPA